MSSGGQISEKNELTWTKPYTCGDAPTKRSGHSFTVIGTNAFLFGGCDAASPVGPTNDLYQLKMAGNFEWVKLSDEDVIFDTPAKVGPVARWQHSACVYDKKFLVIFGGFHSSTNRLNDVCIFDTLSLTWTIPFGDDNIYTPRGNHIPARTGLAPPPRGGHSATVIENRMWVFGGYGGQGYSRRDFNDLYILGLDDMEWQKVPAIKGPPPKPRSNHTASLVNDKIYVFGGWNATEQFSDLCILDTDALTWTTVDCFTEPRWGHTACSVEAIPYWKIFYFGGCTGNLTESRRAQGTFSNAVMVLDSGSDSFDTPLITGDVPCPRSDTMFAYDSKGSRLVFYGGWTNQWLGEIYTLDVGCVVGPPYAIMGIFPQQGPITGGTDLTINGIDFVHDPADPRIKVRFVTKRGGVIDVPATFVSKEKLICQSPNFDQVVDTDGEIEVDVRVAFKDDSFTTTFQKFKFLTVASASSCFAFGPGLLQGGYPGVPTTFLIYANDNNNVRRSTGGDEFTVSIRNEDNKVTDITIEDNGDGSYIVEYTAPAEGVYEIDVEYAGAFKDENGQRYETGKSGPIRGSPFTAKFTDGAQKSVNKMGGPLLKEAMDRKYQYIRKFVTATRVQLEKAINPNYSKELAGDVKALLAIKEKLYQMEMERSMIELDLDVFQAVAKHMDEHHGVSSDKKIKDLTKLRNDWMTIVGGQSNMVSMANMAIKPHVITHGAQTKDRILEYEVSTLDYEKDFVSGSTLPFYQWDTGPDGSINAILEATEAHEVRLKQTEEIQKLAYLFEFPELCEQIKACMDRVSNQLDQMQKLWETAADAFIFFDESKTTPWVAVQPELLEEEAKKKGKAVKNIHKDVRWSPAYKGLDKEVKNFLTTCPLIAQLGGNAMRERHWTALKKLVKKDFVSPDQDDSLCLSEVLDLNLHEFTTEIEDIADQAAKEAKMETALSKLERSWGTIRFIEDPLPNFPDDASVKLLRMSEEDVETLEADQLNVQGMMGSPFVGVFSEPYTNSEGVACKGVKYWHQALGMVSDVTSLLGDIQRFWSYLEPLFIRSEEVKKALPEDAQRFKSIDSDVRKVLTNAAATKSVLKACNKGNLLPTLEEINQQLEKCKKSLVDFLDTKRTLFPRFYFTSEADLLDILSNGSSPAKIMKHITKVFLATKTFELDSNFNATHWVSSVGQEMGVFNPPVPLQGKVEQYLEDALEGCKASMLHNFQQSLHRYETQQRCDWLLNKNGENMPTDLAQISLLVAGGCYVSEVEQVFTAIKGGNKDALKDYHAKQKQQLADLIQLTLQKLDKGDRQRVMCLITMDAHSRDIIDKLIREGVVDKADFQWQSQLKQRVESGQKPTLEICDAKFDYGFEYLGNGSRLVITPLTDRIYVTATQALHLQMGCAPAGPAGTGKTETTKDLASGLGKCCYVFNCAPEMDYRSMGNIFKGLAASGSWGCFDEFNRLIPEVLSVCTVQFKSVCDGIRAGNKTVCIEGAEVALDATCGVFITMNPGYLGRSELPEGLKALFRPMTVMVPDLVLICENMLMAEGFVGAKELASKFYGLYSLCRELLSKQAHYDWGLRAVKSVLVVAGGFKREEPDLHEEDLLLRALRDFNIPKIVQQDEVIFYGLLNDLFPSRNPPRKIDKNLEDAVKEACGARDLWPDDQFLLKCVQLEELLAIRHCVFVMGPPAAGKTECWRTLQRAHQLLGKRTVVRDLNPKTQDASGLYGYISMATREWKDGLLSKTMRDLGNVQDKDPKWIILDGDLDANWIESMNSVMDDNKMLTLASNERIPLFPHMRMIFEIRDLAYATPATTSRAGIIYISTDRGSQWRSLIAAWVQKKEYEDHIREALSELFEKYVPTTLTEIKRRFKTIVPVEPTSMVSSLLQMLDSMIESNEQALVVAPQNARDATKVLESTFGFCVAWALGSAFAEVDGVDYRKEFSDWWKSTFKAVKFPSRETIFDYFLDSGSDRLDMWKNSSYFYNVDFDSSVMSMTNVTIPTPETAAVTFWMERMINLETPVMLVGGAGCGKTAIVRGALRSLNASEHANTTINFNFYTNATALQRTMETSLEKKMGSTFGPPGQGNLIYFLDDLNLPEVDEYNTQDAIALVRQHIDYGHVYDRVKLTPKTIQNCQYIACMNHTAGSFSVNARLQRHFATFAIGFPGPTSLLTIYQTFLDGHLKRFDDSVKALSSNLINGALGIHTEVVNKFRKTAVNFHYEFNIRHLSNVFQGLLVAQPVEFNDVSKFIMLWLHESERVYGDRLVNKEDLRRYKDIAAAQAKRRFPNYNMAKFFAMENADPLVFCHFAPGQNAQDRIYDQVNSIAGLRQTLETSLVEYNEFNTTMNLVLFEDAMKHVCRISRIILNSGGHAMLVGVGGSGKQSLSRLAAHMCSYDTTQIVISATYGISDFKEDLKSMYAKAGLKGDKLMFLFTDGQISDERFLVYINDLLASGKIPDLYTAEEMDSITSAVFNKTKAAGLPTDPASCYDFFIDTVRDNLHCVLCFSPVGENFRMRARKFPALVNCTVIDWFQAWPHDALLSVGKNFLAGIDLDTEEIRSGIEQFMPFSFNSVNRVATEFLVSEKRHVYTTPKSYLELLKLYTSLLEAKRQENRQGKSRLESGLTKLRDTAEVVTKLEKELKGKLEGAEEKKIQAEAQAEEVAKESEIVARETEAANVERAKCDKIAREVQAIKDDAQKDLDAAEPLVKKALDALDTLNKKDLGECKSMSTPPKGVDDVFNAVMILLAGIDPKIQLTKSGKPKNLSWEGCKKEMMGNVNEFLNRLKDFKEEVDAFRVPKCNWSNIRPLLQLEHFDPETIEKKNKAAGGVASWVCNIVNYHDTIVGVEPKRQALAEAEQKLQSATEVLDLVNAKVTELETKLNELKADLEEANTIKQAAIDEVEQGQMKLDLAQRLITALASENVRWGSNIEEFEEKYASLTGDVLVASAFISYIGPFSKEYREKLLYEEWIPFLQKASAGESIPMSSDMHPVSLLANSAVIAGWQCDGLPQDSVSTDNGAISQFSARWPLLIDPQLQGTAWVQAMEKNRAKENNSEFVLTRMHDKDLVRKMMTAIESGHVFMIENMDEHIEASIMPIVRRATITRGTKKVIKLGEHEVALHKDFRLYLHTKLSNPHFPPEIQAECTLVNFTVTQVGLEEQLLSLVVRNERRDLAEQRAKLIRQQNRFTVKIKELEDKILVSLANAEGDICSDVALIEGLEDTKRVANDISEKSATAVQTQEMIQNVSEKYRSVAARGALLFFIMNSMYKMHSYYIYSLNAFVVIFLRGIDLVTEKKEKKGGLSMMARLRAAAKKVIVTKRFDWNQDLLMAGMREDEDGNLDLMDLAKKSEDSLGENLTDEEITERCSVLQRSITEVVFNYIRRGVFDKDHLTIASQLAFKILLHEKVLNPAEVYSLITCRGSADPGAMGPLSSWMSDSTWAKLKGMENIVGLETLGDDIMGDSDEWREWFNQEKPEDHKMPGQYSKMSEFKKLLLFRALRPDRMSDRVASFIEDNIGSTYVQHPSFDMEATYQESSCATPIFFVLFPGVDPTPWVESLGKKYDVTSEKNKFFNISMGQGQEDNAESKIREYAENGGWVMLQNVHLMTSWLPKLESLLESLSQTAHSEFRCFISAEPPAFATWKNIPESLLQCCIKVANESPADLKSNLQMSWGNFSQDRIKGCKKPKEFQQCLFSLCFFHAIVLGRRKFSQMGWSRPYSFNQGDLNICANVLERYISSNENLPWDDIRYILGEIMYGGHITDPWDRRTNNAYLSVLMGPNLFNDAELAPGFKVPPLSATFKDVEEHIEKKLPKEAPTLFGLHPNAEIGYLTNTQDYLFENIFSLGVVDSAHAKSESEGEESKTNTSSNFIVQNTLRDLLSRLPKGFDLLDINERATQLLLGDQAPYVVVCTQECTRMNKLLHVIRHTLEELQKGLDGALNMTEGMEHLAESLEKSMVPGRDPFHKCSWEKYAWWSKKSLMPWFADLLKRVEQLRVWTADLVLPKSVWLPGLFNPTAFNTAIMQVTARKNSIPLDSCTTETHVTTMMDPSQVTDYPEDGAYIHGLYMEGARWAGTNEDDEVGDPWTVGKTECVGHITTSRLKELLPPMPVIYVRAVPVKPEWEPTSVGYLRHDPNIYEAPVYFTSFRGPTYLFLATLKTLDPVSKWVLAGCAIIL
eukprot:CAMPEP_0203746968 /NCGR_PEP_ID=MMETSP0098-20131031/2236_1 /ASSEMBLY_ACC=CAM_ASM_000208 /TAXON_ID=96639 /ORGANISM=" , Strain NY0313808BC1" /LENGTH=4160 /DNA_ID=CAMNT_0050635227 /DNA_START=190 /DNA_END=12669 /DNA_ORIENTATION=+